MTLTFGLIAITVVVSLISFNNFNLRYQLIHNPYIVHHRKEYYRLLTSGFIHADFVHLFFNMFVMYSFGNNMEQILQMAYGANGKIYFLGLYFIGILISSIPSQIKHKNDSSYNSLGASGGVSSVLFAFIMILPTTTLQIFPIPIDIPAWIFAILYVAYSVYMNKKQMDNVNHLAHLWGAAWGVVFAVLTIPGVLVSFPQQILNSLFK